MRAFFLLLSLFCTQLAMTQEIQVNEDPRVGELMRAWATNNHQSARIAGWRVQILSTTDRLKADEAKQQFQAAFPHIVADWMHEKPYYKLRIGACRNKIAAQALLFDIKDYYPGAYIAQDNNIHPRDFLIRQ